MAKVQVVLRANVKSLGIVGEKVTVSLGYARNFLFPRQLAVGVNDSQAKSLQNKYFQSRIKQEIAKKQPKMRKESKSAKRRARQRKKQNKAQN